ncbi:MAG: DEAD/DEAH box helicase family protein [Bacteroidaceae bacterium]|nr:DEAD/DEAH box helicase family protein [Bacteroidaceae bacterium]
MKLIDNIHDRLKDDLATEIRSGSRVAIAASCFSIYAFEELKSQLAGIDELRFIFTSPTFVTEKANKQKREFYIPRLNRERNLYGSEFEVKLRNELSQRAIARECAEWIRQKACFKSNRTGEQMQGFATVDDKAYMPITGFTTVELGCERGDNAYTMINKFEAPFSQSYLSLFDQIWNDTAKMQVVTDEVLDNITNAYKENAPDFIYFVTLYNIFREFLDDLSEDTLPNEATGFKDSVIWGKLYNFQKDACLAIINKLEKYNGCILADSVGLGKTFTALSVIKYYQQRNKNILVLCPKKLNENWMTYRSNYRNNPLIKDRLRYDVLFHTDLSRMSGESNGLNLELFEWSTYDLIVIDESHNFRNGGKVTTDENDENPRENRYLQLLNKVIRKGVKTKVLMLSATPVNNRFNDLKNQIALAYEGDSENIDGLLNTSHSIDDIFRQAQAEYNRWSKLPPEGRTTKELLNRLSFDFFEVLDSVTIARSRKHIEQYYDTTDIGKFPTRLTPIARRPHLTDLDSAINYNEIYGIVSHLNLAIYTPSDFILPSRLSKYVNITSEEEYSGLTMKGRERGIRKLMSINLLKRLESSVNSFRLTLERIKGLIASTIDRINSLDADDADNTDYSLSHPHGKIKSASSASSASEKLFIEVEELDTDFDFDDRETDMFIGGKKTKIALQDLDYIAWRSYLKEDLENLNLLLLMLADITPEHDSKLLQLIDDLRHKFANPINGNNKKVIIFTAFSDTAEYLYDCLAERIREKHGLHTALVTGQVEARTTLNLPRGEKLDFNKVLTLFSPISKEGHTVYPHLFKTHFSSADDTDCADYSFSHPHGRIKSASSASSASEKFSIDVLIATDCISEGQNLQDCDYLINYDIHWNPVRIIQRFGRIDRIGSKNDVIQLVNYWPDMDLDEYIDLKGRVEARMKVSVMTSTGDDNPISPEEKGDLEYRREQLKRLQSEVVDIEEMNTGISIMDLGLNEFRLDLLAYMQDNPNIEHTPFGLHAVVPASEACPPGVVYVLKNRNNGVNIDRKNRLHPFYMVYISAVCHAEQSEASVNVSNNNHSQIFINHLQPKELLDCMRLLCKGKNTPNMDICREFNRITRDGKNMQHYSELLGDAISSIIHVKAESDIDSFLSGAQGSLFTEEIRGLDDFELICFLVIQHPQT